MKRNTTQEDKRPDAPPRKQAHLWQAYLWWNELIEIRKRHTLRATSGERSKTQMDPQTEYDIIEAMQLDTLINRSKKEMVNYAATVGPVWTWLTGIKGLKEGGLAAQLIAHIDDIEKFTTVSKLWRFAGHAVIDGQAERKKQGEKAHYNARLKSVIWQIVKSFVMMQTPGYVDVYYAEKERLRRLYPEPVETNGESAWPKKYTDAHIDRMAYRKVGKIFLQHLWVLWRESEGLPVSDPYVQALMGHTNIITIDMLESA